VQCFGSCKNGRFISVRLTLLVFVLGNFGRIDAVDTDTEGAIREGSHLERRGSSTVDGSMRRMECDGLSQCRRR
jgi:hypothetical protein